MTMPAKKNAAAPAEDEAATHEIQPIRDRQRSPSDEHMPVHHPEAVESARLPAPDEPEAEHCSDYAVGYGRPPAHTRFRPGASGNPKGRPKGGMALKALVRTMMTEKVPIRTGAGVIKMARVQVLLHRVFELALKGDSRAQLQLLNLYAAAVPDASIDASLGEVAEAEESALRLQELSRKFLMKALREK
jgi:hypothetical protein